MSNRVDYFIFWDFTDYVMISPIIMYIPKSYLPEYDLFTYLLQIQKYLLFHLHIRTSAYLHINYALAAAFLPLAFATTSSCTFRGASA